MIVWESARSHNHASEAIVSLVSSWLGDRLGRIKCRIDTAGFGTGVKSSLGAENDLSVPELVGLPCAMESASAAPRAEKNQDLSGYQKDRNGKSTK